MAKNTEEHARGGTLDLIEKVIKNLPGTAVKRASVKDAVLEGAPSGGQHRATATVFFAKSSVRWRCSRREQEDDGEKKWCA